MSAMSLSLSRRSLLGRRARLALWGLLVGLRLVALPALAAPGDHERLALVVEADDQLAGLGVVHQRGRQADGQVVALLAVLLPRPFRRLGRQWCRPASPAASRPPGPPRGSPIRRRRRRRRWARPWGCISSARTAAAVPALAGLHVDVGRIDNHGSVSSYPPPAPGPPGSTAPARLSSELVWFRWSVALASSSHPACHKKLLPHPSVNGCISRVASNLGNFSHREYFRKQLYFSFCLVISIFRPHWPPISDRRTADDHLVRPIPAKAGQNDTSTGTNRYADLV